MNMEIGTEAAQFPEKEHINEVYVAVQRPETRATTPLIFSTKVSEH